MGKRIYNGESGVVPDLQDLRDLNRRENAAVRAGLLPEIRAMYLRKEAERRRERAKFARKGVSH